MTAERFLSVREACALLSMGQTRFYAEVSASKIQVRKMGRRTVVAESEIARYQEALPVIGRKDAA
jgi:predicted DNA-binding transcriptional regulator AlpA